MSLVLWWFLSTVDHDSIDIKGFEFGAISKGRNGTKAKARKEWVATSWINLKLVLIWERMWRCRQTYDSYLTTAWVMQSWCESNGCYIWAKEENWHQSNGEEWISGFNFVDSTGACGWSQTECGHAYTQRIPISLLLGWWNTSERLIICAMYEQRKKWHQSIGDEEISGYIVEQNWSLCLIWQNTYWLPSHYCLGDEILVRE